MGGARELDLFEEAIKAGEQRDYASAVRLLENLLSREDRPEALLYLGRARHALGDYAQAVAAFADYLRFRPHSAQGRLFAGRSFLSLGQPKRALALLEAASKIRPGDPALLFLLGVAALRSKRSALAVKCLEQAVGLAPDNKRIYRAYVNALLVRGLRLSRDGDADLGAQMLRFAIANGVDAVLPRLELARLYRDAGKLEEALEHYTAAISFEPEDPQLRWYRASLLMALDRGDDARAELAVLRRLGADIPDLPWNAELVDRFLIRELLARKEWRRACAACGAWLRKRKEAPAVHAMYSEALRGAGDYEAAENHARRAVQSAPDEPGLRYALLLVLWQKEDWKALDAELKTAKRRGCAEDVLMPFRALLASRTSEDDRTTLALIQGAIHQNGPSPELMEALADRYLRVGLPELAENWYRRTFEVDDRRERAGLGLIAALEALVEEKSAGAADRLKQAYEAYLERYRDNVEILREFALFLVRLQVWGEAAKRLEALLAWDGSNPKLRRLLAYSYRKTDRHREAAVLLKSLLRERPKDLPLLLELARSLEKAGGRAYSIALLQKATQVFPKDADPLLLLGEYLRGAGKKEAALEAFREAVARAPKDPRPLRRLEEAYRKSGIHEFADRYAKEAEKREHPPR